ncbi:murein transglycosylase A [Chromobacterium sphagni]|uniref:peptidoglycan lytic exotransglycosylase n=1 Tax=Chromobacterium sphagni TaxID=1903179 RepID=A0A1S1X063_9NEIS|nr:MltA domain-containing protein [Chromobacterium sphagni]OHX12921.1 murein transglycosylase [Chromobacterium sphagni]OHX19874.1 murein transglycosylase [Chromobacterium sphagni]
MTHILSPKRWPLWLALLILAGCGTTPPSSFPQHPSSGNETSSLAALPAWNSQTLEDSLQALKQSCKPLQKKSAWSGVCREAGQLQENDGDAVRRFFENRFTAWKLHDGNRDSGLVTGYYEPLLSGSRTRSERTPWPVYGVPRDMVSVDVPASQRGRGALRAKQAAPGRLVLAASGDIEINPADFPADPRGSRLKGRLSGSRLLPYFTRGQINQGSISGNAPVIAWVEDPVELFFLQVQGSGRIQLDDGSFIHVGFADQNGYPYQSIGKWLVDQRQMTLGDASMQGIKDWLARNPQRRDELFAVNPSYIFFKVMPGDNGGPVGALGVPLTGGYSIAVDPRYIPLGAPVYLSTTWPHSTLPLTRLVHAQDTGSAIKGALRADLFWGYGTEAGMYAGRMKQQGSMWLLLPKGLTPASAL